MAPKKTGSIMIMACALLAAMGPAFVSGGATGPATDNNNTAARDVRITYFPEEDGVATTQDFDLLVIACDPSSVSDILDGRTDLEVKVEAALQRYSMGTSLWEAERDELDSSFSVRFLPEKLNAADGQVYGFRDEVRARTSNTNLSTLITVYQFASTPDFEMTRKLSEAMDGSLPYYGALGLKNNPKLLKTEHFGDYFPHFSQDDVNAGLPWSVLDDQGAYSTIYVSSFTSHESVNKIYEYGNILEGTGQVQEAFQTAREASTEPRVAIIGAGPSGLLFASQQLKRAGFFDVTIFEKKKVWGGKTRTHYYQAPAAHLRKKTSTETIPAELGTCYLSAAYQTFATMMENKYGLGKPVRIGYGDEDFGPRGILDPATGELISYFLWVLRRPDGTEMSEDEFNDGIGTYVAAHYALVGWNSTDEGMAIPLSKPEDLPDMTFLEYLENLGVGHLRNIFTFSNSVQGYGLLSEIPAYYGLIWSVPNAFMVVLDFAASVSKQLAEAEADGTEARRALTRKAAALKRGSKIARTFRKNAAKEFGHGVRPTSHQAQELAARINERMPRGRPRVPTRQEGLARGHGDAKGPENEEEDYYNDDDDDDGEEEETRKDGVGLIQEGWGAVWDTIVAQDGLESQIKLGVDVVKIERRGLSDYYSASPNVLIT